MSMSRFRTRDPSFRAALDSDSECATTVVSQIIYCNLLGFYGRFSRIQRTILFVYFLCTILDVSIHKYT
jgi:hypothetical protein